MARLFSSPIEEPHSQPSKYTPAKQSNSYPKYPFLACNHTTHAHLSPRLAQSSRSALSVLRISRFAAAYKSNCVSLRALLRFLDSRQPLMPSSMIIEHSPIPPLRSAILTGATLLESKENFAISQSTDHTPSRTLSRLSVHSAQEELVNRVCS